MAVALPRRAVRSALARGFDPVRILAALPGLPATWVLLRAAWVARRSVIVRIGSERWAYSPDGAAPPRAGAWERSLVAGALALGDTVRATPSASWTAAVIDRVPPSLPPSTANRPRTGADLRAWREKRELSQTEAARVLGVGKRTIVRAEVAADAALPRAFGRATWEAAASPIEGES